MCTGSALQGGLGPLVHFPKVAQQVQAETRLPRKSGRISSRSGEVEGGLQRGWKDVMEWKRELRKLLAEGEDFQAGTLE